MDIYIMGNKIDYTIENERTVRDVVESISEIVNGYGHSITELRVDGKTFVADDPALENIEISEVNNLEIETASFFEISSSLIFSLIPYTQLLVTHITQNNLSFEQFDQAKTWITEVLITSLNTLFVFAKDSGFISKRDEIVNYILNFPYSSLFDEERKKEFLKKLDELNIFLKDIIEVINKISEEGNLFFDTTIDNDLSELLRLTDEISIKLQLGNDKGALRDVYEFSNIFTNLVEFVDYAISSSVYAPTDVINKFDWSKFEKVNTIIESIIESISNRDFVSASDIMSYELKPILEELREFIILLRDRMFSQIAEN